MSQSTASTQVIRRLYQITNNYQLGFTHQINEIIAIGLERFNLDIGILSHIKDDTYTVVHCIVPDGVELKDGDSFDFNNTYCNLTCKSNGPVAIEHVEKHDILGKHPAYQAFGLESYIGVPITVNDKLYGTLNFSSPTPYPRQFNEEDIDTLQLIASWIGVELVRRAQEKRLAELNEELEQQAFYDSLTKLPNRRHTFKHLKKEFNQQLRGETQSALAIIDIDHFKCLNDNYGHAKGDEALREVAKQLKLSTRDYDFIARFGGEEFILWMPNTTAEESKIVTNRIKSNLRKVDIVEEDITVSIGVCTIDFSKARDYKFSRFVDLALEQADKALYLAKENGRNRVEYSE